MSNYDSYIDDTVIGLQNFKITDEQKSRVVWLIRKYLSYSWIKRTSEHLNLFTQEYEKFVSKNNTEFYREALEGLIYALSQHQSALSEFEKGDLRKAYSFLHQGYSLSDILENPMEDMAHNFIVIGYRRRPRPSVGLYSLVSTAIRMSSETRRTLNAEHCLPQMLVDATFPPDIQDWLEPIATLSKELVTTEEEVPITGIWLPVTHPHGCPAYLSRGNLAPPIIIPSSENRKWDTEEDFKTGLPYRKVWYFKKETPGKFVLLWKEDRYRMGRIPDEPEYLDPTVELPKEIPPTPKPGSDDY